MIDDFVCLLFLSRCCLQTSSSAVLLDRILFFFSRLLLLSYDPSLLHVYHIYNEQILFLLKILPRVVEFSVFFFSFL